VVRTPDGIFDVAIVGYGPTGATLAKLLGMQGLAVAVLEREPGLLRLPRAVHFDGEVMRIFETAGIAGALAPRVRPSGGMRYVNAAGEVMIERQPAGEPGPHGWANNYLFHQPDLELTLRDAVAQHPRVQVFAQREVTAVSQDAQGVVLATDAGPVTARWAVGCDGARSLVRQAIGADHHDLGLHQPWLVVDVVLKRPVELPHPTVQYCHPGRPVTYVNVTGARRRWEIMLMPGDVAEEMTRPEAVWRLLAPWLGPDDAALERGAVYTFHSLVATRWRDRRLLIGGDAAHQTPPFLGQGMCAGIRDAANLAWKLARVAAGRSGEALLDTYQSEREPHARAFIAEAVRLGGILQTTDPAVAAARDRRFRETGREEMVNLSPRLGSGAHAGPPPAGEIFPQPLLADGRRLDAAIGGYRFAVLAPRARHAELAPLCAANAVALVDFATERLVLLRPDRYVAGVADSAAALERLLQAAGGDS